MKPGSSDRFSPVASARPAPRRFPIGAELHPGGAHFRVWAPRASSIRVELQDRDLPVQLGREEGDYHSGWAPDLAAGTRYRFWVEDRGPFPDPASRFQPEGPHGPSQVVDAGSFIWTDRSWKGVGPAHQVIYELHLGTFTPEGTWNSALTQLPRLKELGVTVLEVMPVADFPGRFGWGYDGVNLFAPSRLYGGPDDARRFVDQAHALGMGVILDVVYNHLGPDGNYLTQFSDHYFTDRYSCEWGAAINFDGPQSAPVREYFISNAVYWITEFHFDGLRFDATQAIKDASGDHILGVLQRRVRDAVRSRELYLVGENESQQSSLVRRTEAGGMGLDALWNDDFHHTAYVALTGSRESYFADYLGSPQELLSALRWGFLYQGQRYSWQKKSRGTPGLDLPATAFINFLENHDQVANTGHGRRLWQLSSPGRYRALTALCLLGPGTPLLFQGQEFASSKPFLYFADHPAPLGPAIVRGRTEFLAQSPSLASVEARALLSDPTDPSTFERSKLDLEEIDRRPDILRLHQDLLALRRDDPVIRGQHVGRFHGAVLGPDAFLLRWQGEQEHRLLAVNFGCDLHLVHAPEPLLAPPEGLAWELAWSSESPAYGGRGIAPLEREGSLLFPGAAAVLLR